MQVTEYETPAMAVTIRGRGRTAKEFDVSDRTCSIEGCDRGIEARGWCSMHYLRWKRHGDLGDACPRRRGKRPKPLEERFWAKVRKTPTCWLWEAYIAKTGYGHIRINETGRPATAHRVAYELCVGPIPQGYDIDHTCYVRHCVNPGHLQAVTHQKNGENRSGNASNNTTGARGVYFDKSRGLYVAEASVHRKKYHGGRYETLAEAEAAAIALRNRIMTNNLADRRLTEG